MMLGSNFRRSPYLSRTLLLPLNAAVPHRRTLSEYTDRVMGRVIGAPEKFNGTLLVPLALLLVAGGGYQLGRNNARPLESDAAAILFGTVTLACGLLSPKKSLAREAPPQRFHRYYVDEARSSR
jgi:hypothetical protein